MQPYIICYVKLTFVVWVCWWVVQKFFWCPSRGKMNSTLISLIFCHMMVFSLTLTLRFFGCGKKTNIYFILLWRFDEYGYPLIIIFIIAVIINILSLLLLLLLLLLVLLLLLPFSLLQNYFNKSVNFFSEASKCCKIVFRSHYVICILPLYIGGKNKTGILKIFRTLFRKTSLRACVVMNHYNSFGCTSNKCTFSTP